MHPHLARFGPVTIPTFGAIAAAGLVLSILLAARGARIVRISEDAVWNLCLFTAAGTLLLSRLIIIAQVPRSFLHYPMYILTLPTVTQYGLLAALASAIGYALLKHLPLLRTADAMAPAALLLQSSLHAGSLFAGDDLGSPVSTWVGQLIPGDRGFHPVALYAGLLSLVSAAVTFLFLSRKHRPGETFGLALTLAALARFFIDELRPDYVLPETMAGFLRLDQVVLIALSAGGLCFFFQRGARHAQ